MNQATILEALIKTVIVIGGLATGAAYLVLLERKMAAWVQDRIGPNRVGIPLTNIRLFGLGQPLADGLKIIFKEDFTPAHVDRRLFTLAPIIDSGGRLGRLCRDSVWQCDSAELRRGRDRRADSAGRRSGRERGHALRLCPVEHRGVRRDPGRLGQQQQVQLPGRAAIECSADCVRTADGAGIVGRGASRPVRSTWRRSSRGRPPAAGIVLLQPLGFIVFVVAAFAEAARLPFDLPECEQELVGGYHTEYSGMRLLLFLLTEFLHMITAALLIVILFLGGWHLPFGLTGYTDDGGLVRRHRCGSSCCWPRSSS